jgi:ectoine hydroxylase-related dioxygenase (phytanoyl-CoA dioxygenase family)
MKAPIQKAGFQIENDIYTEKEVQQCLTLIEENKKEDNNNFRASKDLYAIRNLLQEIPSLYSVIINEKLKAILNKYFGENWFVVKGIYFDKPPLSTWFVNWHQDLTISVDKKFESPGFINWTLKAGQQSVQPKVSYLKNILTVRIHLDDTDEQNGGLHVIPGSHLYEVIPDGEIKEHRAKQTSSVCNVKRGGIMLMKPLTLHASYKSTGTDHRRVIHIEFTNEELPNGMKWRERV